MNTRTQLRFSLLLALSLFGSVFSTPSAADALPTYGILPASVLRIEAIELPSKSLAGPGKWQGLVCSPQGCELRPVRLAIQKQPGEDKVRISYAPVGKRSKVKGEFTIALVNSIPGVGKKAIPTWFTLRTSRRPEDAVNGSLGVTVQTPEQGDYHLVPRWNPKPGVNTLTLYLEHNRQRQPLGLIDLDVIRNAAMKTSAMLIWAGDLDGDGKIDLITRVREGSSASGLYLWLSTHAGEGEMVGVAAFLDDWTDVEEADGC